MKTPSICFVVKKLGHRFAVRLVALVENLKFQASNLCGTSAQVPDNVCENNFFDNASKFNYPTCGSLN